MRSLSRLLLVALIAVVLVGGGISGAIAWRSSLIEVGELFDAKLAHSARVLHGLVDGGLDQGDGTLPQAPIEIALWSGEVSGHGVDLQTPLGHGYETRLAFQVFDASGRLLLRSDSAPLAPIAPLSPGFAEAVVDGVRWRSFALRGDSGRWYLAAERADVRADIAGDISGGILMPLLIELPITAVLICIAIGIGRRALRRVTEQVQARAADRLQPIDSSNVPEEVAGLVDAVNGLLAALDTALSRERRFTADAAHELRTPLAGMRVQLTNLQAAQDAGERTHAERQLDRGLHRLEHLLAQMLLLARLEPGAATVTAEPVDLATVCRDVIAEFVDAAMLDDVDLSLDAEGPAIVRGEPVALASLVRNLVDNALRYSGRPATVTLRLVARDAQVILRVEDAGPGIPPDERERVRQRFYRRLGSGSDGSGLGLSIVQRVVDRFGGTLELGESPGLGGLSATVRLPARRTDRSPVGWPANG